MVHRLALILIPASLLSILAAPLEELPAVKDMHLETDLRTCVIAVPDGPDYASAAARIRHALRTAGAASVDIVRAAQLDNYQEHDATVVTMGLFDKNPIVEALYLRGLILCDYSWPKGETGFVIRTVHNPWQTGKNLVFIGSATDKGRKQAVETFARILHEAGTPEIDPIIHVQGDDQPKPLSTEAETERLQSIAAEASSRAMGSRAAGLADHYFKTGDPCWARLFLAGMRRLDDLQAAEGAADDVRSCRYIFNQFDRIEEGPAFTPAEREELSRIFYRFAQRLRYAKTPVKPSTMPHGNDWNAMGASYAALYYTRYYPELSLGKTLLERLDALFKPNMNQWKVEEDCPGYGRITFRGNYEWAIQRPVPEFITSGRMKQMTDYMMLITTNHGTVSGFGDSHGIHGKYLPAVYPLAAWLYKDGRYLWWWENHGGNRTVGWVPDEVLARKRPDDLLGVCVAPLAEWIYRRRNITDSRSFPIEQCFDKVTFRPDFSTDDPYLCLSGFGYGFHAHPDANAIINYSAHGQTFLYDDGYMIPSLREHNTITIVRDGFAENVPELARITANADFSNTGIFSSRLQNYNGVDWDRTIIWLKPGTLVVIDDLAVDVLGMYGFQCIWRTLGRTQLDGRRWTSVQETSRFNLVACGNAALSAKPSAGFSLNANPLEPDQGRALIQAQAGELSPGDRVTFATAFRTESAAGKPNEFRAILSSERAVTLTGPDGPALVATALEPTQAGRLQCGPLRLDRNTLDAVNVTALDLADLALRPSTPVDLSLDLQSGALALVGPRGTTVNLTEPAGPERTLALENGRVEVTLRNWTGGRAADIIAALAPQLQQTLPDPTEKTAAGPDSVATTPTMKTLWKYSEFDIYRAVSRDPETTISVDRTCLTPEQAGYPVGTPDDLLQPGGNVMFPDGETVTVTIDLGKRVDINQILVQSRQLKTFNGGCGVRRLTASVSKDGFTNDTRKVAALDVTAPLPNAKVPCPMTLDSPVQGRYVRIVALPYSPDHNVYFDSVSVNARAERDDISNSGFRIHDMNVVDGDGDGKSEIVAAGTDRAIHMIDDTGDRLWKRTVPNTVNALAAYNGPKGHRVAAACDDHTLYCFTATGAEAWTVTPPPRTYARPGYRGVKPFTGRLTVLFPADLNNDGAVELLVGAANWRTYCYSGDGERLWDECCWAHTPTCGTAADLDGDAVKEVIMCNSYTRGQVYNADGELIGHVGGSHHAGPTAIVAEDLDNNGKTEVIVGDKAGKIWFQEWKGRDLPVHATGTDISAVAVTDLDRDGNHEIIAASKNFLLYAFDANGAILWTMPLYDGCQDIQTANVMGNEDPELILACEDGTIRVTDGQGLTLIHAKAESAMRVCRVCELDGNADTKEIVAACDNGTVYALQIPGDR